MDILGVTDNYRLRADKLIQQAATLTSMEATNAWNCLRMAKAWIGKIKGELGSRTPYAVVDSVDKIPPTAEVYNKKLPTYKSDLEKVNALRLATQTLLDEIDNTYPKICLRNGLRKDFVDNCYQHLAEAKMWYGFELARMREAATASKSEKLVARTPATQPKPVPPKKQHAKGKAVAPKQNK